MIERVGFYIVSWVKSYYWRLKYYNFTVNVILLKRNHSQNIEREGEGKIISHF